MLTRTADHLFWMARYIERADSRGMAADAAKAHARLARVKPAGAGGRSQDTARCSRPRSDDA